MTVLIVEDSLFIREILVQACVEFGMHVVAEATTGDEAVEAAIRLRPDLIILDLVLPDKNGLEAAKSILAENSKAQILAMSSLNEVRIHQSVKEIGCREMLVKPFTKMDLHQAFQKFFIGSEGLKYG